MNKSANFTKIIIEKRNGIKHIIIWFLITLLFAVIEYITLKRFYDCIFILLIIIPLVLKDYVKKEKYLSEIKIYDKYIQLVYKCRDVIVSTKNIKKQNIKIFHVDSYIPELYDRTYYANTSIKIELQEGEKIVYDCSTNQSSLTGLFDSNWQTIINIVKEHDKIPNFSYNISGNCEYAKAQVEHYYRFKKNFSMIDNWKIRYKTSTTLGKFNTIVGAIGMLFGIICLVGVACLFVHDFLIPDMSLLFNKHAIRITVDKQKEFMDNYNNAYSYYQNENYNEALKYISFAENIYDRDCELYILKAFCYQELEESQKAIYEAEKSLQYKENQSIYKIQNKYRFNLDTDITAYEIIGRNAYKLKLYDKSESAYSYIIDNAKYKYKNYAYFMRGKSRYHLNNIKGAKEDFFKAKEIIQEYLIDQQTIEFPDKELRSDENDIRKIDQWIKKCS